MSNVLGRSVVVDNLNDVTLRLGPVVNNHWSSVRSIAGLDNVGVGVGRGGSSVRSSPGLRWCARSRRVVDQDDAISVP